MFFNVRIDKALLPPTSMYPLIARNATDHVSSAFSRIKSF